MNNEVFRCLHEIYFAFRAFSLCTVVNFRSKHNIIENNQLDLNQLEKVVFGERAFYDCRELTFESKSNCQPSVIQ